jgi:zinc protease
MMSTAYLWHNYGNTTIGSRADIERVPADALRRFYEKYYQPDNAVLIVAGKIDKDKTLALVQKHFGPLPRPARKLEPTYTVEPQQDGERVVTLRRSGDVAVVGLMYHVVAAADERYAPVTALEYVLADKPTGGCSCVVEPGSRPASRQRRALRRTGRAAHRGRRRARQVAGEGARQDDRDRRAAQEPPDRRDRPLARQPGQGLRAGVEQRGAAMFSRTPGARRLAPLFLGRDRIEKTTAAQASRPPRPSCRQPHRRHLLPTKEQPSAPLVEAPDVTAAVKDYKGRSGASEASVRGDGRQHREAHVAQGAPVGMKIALLP